MLILKLNKLNKNKKQVILIICNVFIAGALHSKRKMTSDDSDDADDVEFCNTQGGTSKVNKASPKRTHQAQKVRTSPRKKRRDVDKATDFSIRECDIAPKIFNLFSEGKNCLKGKLIPEANVVHGHIVKKGHRKFEILEVLRTDWSGYDDEIHAAGGYVTWSSKLTKLAPSNSQQDEYDDSGPRG